MALLALALAMMAVVYMMVASQVQTHAEVEQTLHDKVSTNLGVLVSFVIFKKPSKKTNSFTYT